MWTTAHCGEASCIFLYILRTAGSKHRLTLLNLGPRMMDTQRWSSPENPPPLAVLAASTRRIFRTGIGSDKKLAWKSTLAFPFKKLRRLMLSTGSYPSVCNHCLVPRCPPSRSGLRCCSYAGLLARMMLASLGFLGWFFFLSFFSTNSRLSALLDLLRSSSCSIYGWIVCG